LRGFIGIDSVIINSRKELLKVISNELSEIKQKYSVERRTKIIDAVLNYDIEETIQKQSVLITVTLQGYIKRQKTDIERLQRNENTPIPKNIDYKNVVGLSNEVKQKLSEAQPESIARASRLPGITPAAISLLMVHIKKHRKAVGE